MVSGKTAALQIMWFIFIVTFIMLLTKRNFIFIAIFFDLEKAFFVWKIGMTLIFRGHLPTFTDGFLSNQLFKFRAGSTLSDRYEQEMDVPQGSILSAVLFSLTFMIL